MNETLLAGYTAYTTTEEYGTSALADGPASLASLIIQGLSLVVSAGYTIAKHC